jgi:hypothetical protein
MKELIQVGRIAAVKVPEKSDRLRISRITGKPRLVFYASYSEYSNWIHLPEGNWTILGRALELTEEQKRLVLWHDTNLSGRDFINVISSNKLETTYTSLLEAHQIDNNYILILNKEG